jgi:hypothetical protein
VGGDRAHTPLTSGIVSRPRPRVDLIWDYELAHGPGSDRTLPHVTRARVSQFIADNYAVDNPPLSDAELVSHIPDRVKPAKELPIFDERKVSELLTEAQALARKKEYTFFGGNNPGIVPRYKLTPRVEPDQKTRERDWCSFESGYSAMASRYNC